MEKEAALFVQRIVSNGFYKGEQNEKRNAGYHQVQFDAEHLSSGVYFYSIQAGNFRQIRKMILMK